MHGMWFVDVFFRSSTSACTRFSTAFTYYYASTRHTHLFMPICVPSLSPLHSSPFPSQPRPPPQPRPPAPCRFLAYMSHVVGPSWSNFPAGISPIGIVLYFNSTKEMFATASETQIHGNHWMGIEKRGVSSANVWSILCCSLRTIPFRISNRWRFGGILFQDPRSNICISRRSVF